MKGLFLVSTLIVPSLAVLLIPKSEYITHNLFKDSEKGGQCDDCCDKKVGCCVATVQLIYDAHLIFGAYIIRNFDCRSH